MKRFADTIPKPSAIADELREAERSSQKLGDEIAKLKKKLPDVEKKVAELSTAISSTKQEKQRLTALGESVETVKKQLEKLEKELDEKGDEAAGINALLIDDAAKLENLATLIQEKSKEQGFC